VLREFETHREEIESICRRFQVRRLDLFGSAASERFDPESSDLDFLVEFSGSSVTGAADAYFGLLEALTELFHRNVDLVVASAIRNPYFRESIEQSRTLLYAA
jgi:predicted nucleotidyltransferase